MKVHYTRSILDRISEAKAEAQKLGKEIDYIELTLEEAKKLDREIDKGLHRTYRTDVSRNFHKGEVLVAGIRIRCEGCYDLERPIQSLRGIGMGKDF